METHYKYFLFGGQGGLPFNPPNPLAYATTPLLIIDAKIGLFYITIS